MFMPALLALPRASLATRAPRDAEGERVNQAASAASSRGSTAPAAASPRRGAGSRTSRDGGPPHASSAPTIDTPSHRIRPPPLRGRAKQHASAQRERDGLAAQRAAAGHERPAPAEPERPAPAAPSASDSAPSRLAKSRNGSGAIGQVEDLGSRHEHASPRRHHARRVIR